MRLLMTVGLIFSVLFLVVLSAFGRENNLSGSQRSRRGDDSADNEQSAPPI
jgi:hypothetical protein